MNFRSMILVVSVMLSSAVAQDRMPPIPMDKMTPAQKKAAQELIAGPRGAVFGPFVPLMRSPELLSPLQQAGLYLRFHSALGPKLNEFVILLTARLWTAQYEFDAHMPLAVKAGLKQDIVTAVAEGRRPLGMAEDEEIAYDFWSELQNTRSVSDATYARAVKKLGEQGVIDLVGLTGYYTTIAMTLNVARTPLPEGKKPPLPAFPR